MKIPKNIEEALRLKAKYYRRAIAYGYVVDEFCDKHGIEINDYDRADGCEAICNPESSTATIREAILNK